MGARPHRQSGEHNVHHHLFTTPTPPAVASLLVTVDHFMGTADGGWALAQNAASLALIGSLVLALNPSSISGEKPAIGSDTTAKTRTINELRRDFEQQLNAAKTDSSSLEAECKSVPHICESLELLRSEDERVRAELLRKANTVALPRGTDSQKVADSLAKSLASMGWTKGEVVTGDKIDWEKNRRDAGPQAFAKETIDTVEKYAEHRKGTSAADIAGTKIVTDNTPAELHATFLRGEGVIPVQFTQASCVNGSTGFDGQKVIRFAELCYEPGDIWWVPVGPDGTVYWAAAVRADCGNPGLYLVPYPRDRLAPSVCPLGSDRPGKSILGGCYGKPEQPKPPADTPTAQPSPEKVKVCINSDGATAYVPKSEVHMYQRPNADGTCVKNPGTEAANKGNAGNGGGRSQDPGPDATTTPSQPPGTPRVNPTVPAPDPSAPPPTNPATGCVPYRGRPCP